MKKQILIMAVGFSLSLPVFSQSVGINDNGIAPDNSAMLDVSSNNKGVLISRLTTVERDAIQNPAHGLMIFNLDCDVLQFLNSNGNWISFPPSLNVPQTPTDC